MTKMRFIKITAVAVIVMTTSLFTITKPMAISQEEEQQKEHSISEVTREWDRLKPKYDGDVFSEAPSVSYPYKVGIVNEGYLEDALNYMNFVRYIAYLKPLELDEELTKQAQYGAVLTNANNELEHTNPAQPKGMSDDFYNIGKKSTASSNLSGGGLLESIQLCLNDNRNIQGVDDIGHREWLLDPTVTKIGFGTTLDYSVQNLPFGEFAKDAKIPDYLSWPSQGAFPNQFINRSAMWSINLNKNVFSLKNIDDIIIRITRVSDNKQWELHNTDQLSGSISGFKLSTNNNHGDGSSTLIFHIANSELADVNYLGEYKVEILGLKSTDDKDKNIEYVINFFEFNAEDKYNH